MTAEALENRKVRAAFQAEVRRSTHATALAGGLIALVVMPCWIGFDHLVDPANASLFTKLRLLLEVPMAALWLLLLTDRGRRRPEPIMLILTVLIEASIAFMISRLDQGLAAYALGMSLVIYASAFLLIWSWRYTAALIVLTWLALATAVLAAADPLSRSELGTVAFYLGTASVIAFVGQFLRERTAWREFTVRMELEREQEHSRELLRRLERLSREDPLTGLANRRCWDESLAREFERSRRHGASMTLLLCDVDRLKEINDRFGHATVDHVLKGAAEALTSRVRASDLVARLGGDEFAVLCPDTHPRDAAALAEDLRAEFGELRPPEMAHQDVSVSIGVAGLKASDQRPEDLLARADNRLYRAKRVRNAVCAEVDDSPASAHA